MRFVEKAIDRVARKVEEWAMRKKGIQEALVRAVMSLYEDTKTTVTFGSCCALTIWRHQSFVHEICNNFAWECLRVDIAIIVVVD